MSIYWHYISTASLSVKLHTKTTITGKQGQSFSSGFIVNSAVIDVCINAFEPSEVEDLLELSAPYDSEALNADLLTFCKTFPTLNFLYSPAKHNYLLSHGVALIDKFPSIAFRLRILKECIFAEFSRTLFCLWFIVFESEKTERVLSDFEDLFLVGLCHDLGLLDLDPTLDQKRYNVHSSSRGVNTYYDHVYFSACFVERQGDISNVVIRGIKQHHENMDGTGYPVGASGNLLSEYGQHVHLYDTLYSIYIKNYQPINKNLADLKPIIEINAVTHFGRIAVTLIDLLSLAPKSEGVFFARGEFESIQSETEFMAEHIEKSLAIIQDFTALVGFRHEDKALFILQNSFIHIALSYYKLRVLHKQAIVADVMEEGGDYKRLSKAVEDNYLSLREILFHINQFLCRLKFFQSHYSEDAISEQVSLVIEKLSRLSIKRLS